MKSIVFIALSVLLCCFQTLFCQEKADKQKSNMILDSINRKDSVPKICFPIDNMKIPGDDKPIIYDQIPEYPGGYNELMLFLRDNLKYPQAAQNAKIDGIVIVNFVITKDGKISKVKVLRSLGFGCDEEVLRIMKLMPDWKPGKNKGEAVDVYLNLPIRFVMEDNKAKKR